MHSCFHAYRAGADPGEGGEGPSFVQLHEEGKKTSRMRANSTHLSS